MRKDGGKSKLQNNKPPVQQETREEQLARLRDDYDFFTDKLAEATENDAPRQVRQDLLSAITEVEEALFNPRFGETMTGPNQERIVGALPGVDITFPQEGPPSIGIEGSNPETMIPQARMGMRAVRDAAQGVIGLGADAWGAAYGVPNAGRLVRLPEIEVANDAEMAGAALLQYGLPGGAAGRAASLASRGLPWFARSVLGTGAAAGADFAVTDPNQAVTLGDVVNFGPTQIEEDDSDFTRRLKVSAEAGGIAGVFEVLLGGGAAGWRVASRALSNNAEADDIVRGYMRRAYATGASTGDDTPYDTARTALAELIEARRVYAAEGIEAVPKEMQRFVDNDIRVTVPDYLAARGINLGAIEIANEIARDPRVVGRRAENVQSIGASARNEFGTNDPAAGSRLGDTAAGAVRQADTEAEDAYQQLYRSVEADLRNANQQADTLYAAAMAAMENADELRAAGNVEEAVRVERQAAMDLRNGLYRAIDPNGTIRVGPKYARDQFAAFEQAVEPTEISGFRIIKNSMDRINAAQAAGTLSYRDILDLERDISRVINNGSEGSQVYFEELVNFRNSVQQHYLGRVTATRPFAAQIAEQARGFVRDEFSPRFRQFAGADAERAYRGREGVSAGQMGQEFLNTGGARADDAATLNRILQGTSVDPDSPGGVGLRRQGLPTQSRTPMEYEASVQDVTDLLLGRMFQRMNPQNLSAATANRFVRQYSDVLDQFPPQVRRNLESVANSIEDTQNAGIARDVLQRAAQKTERLGERIGNITPRTDVNRITAISQELQAARNAGANTEASQSAVEVARSAALRRQEVAERTLTRVFSQRGMPVNAQDGIARIFGGKNPAMDIRAVIQESGDPQAVRQAVSDYLFNDVARLSSVSPDPSQVRTAIGRLQAFFENPKNDEALRAIYGNDAMRSFRRMADQMSDMRRMDQAIDTGVFDEPVKNQAVIRNIQQILEELAGATGGMSGRVQQRSTNELMNRLRGFISTNQPIEQLVNTRLVEVTLDPAAAEAFLRPFSEQQSTQLLSVLIQGGRSAFLAAVRAIDDERQGQAVNRALTRDYTGL